MLAGWQAASLAAWLAGELLGLLASRVSSYFAKHLKQKVCRLWPVAAAAAAERRPSVHSAAARDLNPNYFLPTPNKKVT